MQVCIYACMQVCKYASMQVCKYASMQVYKYMQINAERYICPQLRHFFNFFVGPNSGPKKENTLNPKIPIFSFKTSNFETSILFHPQKIQNFKNFQFSFTPNNVLKNQKFQNSENFNLLFFLF